MHIQDSNFEAIEKKVSDIQARIDSGLVPPASAHNALIDARAELFALRQLLRRVVEIEDAAETAPETFRISLVEEKPEAPAAAAGTDAVRRGSL